MHSLTAGVRTLSAFWAGVMLTLGTTPLTGCSNDPIAADTPAPHEEPAILSRQSRDSHACRVASPPRLYDTANRGFGSPSLARTTAGDAFLAAIERPVESSVTGMPPDVRLVVAPMGIDGGLGTPSVPDTGTAIAWDPPVIAPYGDGLVVAWFTDESLRIVALDARGAVVRGPLDVPAAPIVSRYNLRPAVVEGPDRNLVIAYVSFAFVDEPDEDVELRLVVLEPDLTPVAPSRVVASLHERYPIRFAVVATSDGYALIRTALTTESRFDVYFESLDAKGNSTAEPHLLPNEGPGTWPFGGFEDVRLALHPVPGGFLASWVEYLERSAVVRVARLDETGALKGSPVLLGESEDAVDLLEPSFLQLEDATAMLFAHGKHIFNCAGCVPDHRIDLVLIDPETLDPLSDVVSVQPRHPAPGPTPRGCPSSGSPCGGLLGRCAVVVGDDVLMAFVQQYHVNGDVGSATFACEAK